MLKISIDVLKEILFFYNEVAIYLVFGFLVAGLLHIFFSEESIKKNFGKDDVSSIIKATIFGIPLPLCSCGVLPVAASLRKNGASKGAAISFLITTPQVGADSFMITYSLLGWVFALFRIIASVITGFIAGLSINFLKKDEKSPLDMEFKMADMKSNETFISRAKNVISHVEYAILGPIATHLIIGIILAGFIAVFVPDDFFAKYLGSDILSMFLMLIIGIPMYVCASASTPIAAALIIKGISPGAALIFLLTGPATNAIGISTVARIVGKKALGIYLLSIAGVSIILGIFFNMIVAKYGFQQLISVKNVHMLPEWLKAFGSVLLTFMLCWYYLSTKLFIGDKKNMKRKVVLNVNGMSCMHCSKSVQTAVEKIKGASDVLVDLKEKNVSFNIEDEGSVKNVKDAIISAGFEVI